MARKPKFPKALFDYMAIFDDDTSSNGAWQARLEDAVNEYNEANKTRYDSFDAWHAYIARSK